MSDWIWIIWTATGALGYVAICWKADDWEVPVFAVVGACALGPLMLIPFLLIKRGAPNGK